jgi:hypothetical protein
VWGAWLGQRVSCGTKLQLFYVEFEAWGAGGRGSLTDPGLGVQVGCARCEAGVWDAVCTAF